MDESVLLLDDRRCEEMNGICVAKSCCSNFQYANDLCAKSGQVCCYGVNQCLEKADEEWPEGNFGLIEPALGCPDVGVLRWLTGSISLRVLDDSGMKFIRSMPFRILGPNNNQRATLNFCIMVSFLGVKRNKEWPRGDYCLVHTEPSCPNG